MFFFTLLFFYFSVTHDSKYRLVSICGSNFRIYMQFHSVLQRTGGVPGLAGFLHKTRQGGGRSKVKLQHECLLVK